MVGVEVVDSPSVLGAEGDGDVSVAAGEEDAEGTLAGAGVAGWLTPVAVDGSWVVSVVSCVTCVPVGLGGVGFAWEVRSAAGAAGAVAGAVLLAGVVMRWWREWREAAAAPANPRLAELSGCERSPRTSGWP